MKVCFACGSKLEIGDTWQCFACGSMPAFNQGFLSFINHDDITDESFFPEEAFTELFKLESKHFWFNARNNLILWSIKKYFFIAKNFLEIGCGTGFVLDHIALNLRHLDLFGSEIYSSGLQHAKQRLPQVNLFQMDAKNIPFSEEFDIIGAFDVLEHIEQDELVLSQIFKALTPGGGIILTVPQHQFLWSRQDDYACHKRRYSAKDLKQKILTAGFEIIAMNSFIAFLLPVMFGSRFFKRYTPAVYDPLSELKLNSIINAMFTFILKMEQFLIRGGLRLPFGGSLLLIAKKPIKS